MKKYYSRAAMWVGIITILFVLIILGGVISLLIPGATEGVYYIVGGAIGFLIFSLIFFAELSRKVTIDKECISFPSNFVFVNGKMRYKRVSVELAAIRFIQTMVLHRGDKYGDFYASEDCRIHIIFTENCTEIAVRPKAMCEKTFDKMFSQLQCELVMGNLNFNANQH